MAPNSPSMVQLREDIRADNAAPWRNKLDSLDLLPDYIRQKGMLLGFPQDVPKDPPPVAPTTPPPATPTPALVEPKEQTP